MTEPIDYLKADETTIPGQKYALISIVSPESNQKNKTCGVKIRGVFEDIEEAKMHAKKLSTIDPIFDVFLVEMYKWLPVPPNKEMIENQEYQDEVLNTIIKTHTEEQVKAKQFFEERKQEMMADKPVEISVEQIQEAIENNVVIEAPTEEPEKASECEDDNEN